MTERIVVVNVWSAARVQGRNSKEESQSAQMYPAFVETNLRALDEFRACLSW